MPKAKKATNSGTNGENKKEYLTDINKSVVANYKERLDYWEKTRENVRLKNEEIEKMKQEYESIPAIPSNRAKRANLRVKIEEETAKVESVLRDSINEVEYIGCLGKVIQESYTQKEASDKAKSEEVTPMDTSETTTESGLDILQKGEVHVVNTSGPMKPRVKRKKLNQSRGNTVVTTSRVSFATIEEEDPDQSNIQCKKLAQLLHEIPIDQSEVEYCPSCPDKQVLEYIEKPPSMCCMKCSLSRETIDISSSAVHDKETPVHIPFTYRPKQHFESWINKITGTSRQLIPQHITNKVILELGNMRIEKVKDVTWDVVDRILRNLSSKEDKSFSEHYQHVYQITNIIRGAPVLNLNAQRKQTLLDMFDVIYESWQRNKPPERSNFMSNTFVLQMCFAILGYPDKVIGMFNMLKGSENLKDYDRLCRVICEENGWDWEKVQSSVLANAKFSNQKVNILDKFQTEDNDDDDNPFLQKASTFPQHTPAQTSIKQTIQSGSPQNINTSNSNKTKPLVSNAATKKTLTSPGTKQVSQSNNKRKMEDVDTPMNKKGKNTPLPLPKRSLFDAVG